jgi:hypothetical protein
MLEAGRMALAAPQAMLPIMGDNRFACPAAAPEARPFRYSVYGIDSI